MSGCEYDPAMLQDVQAVLESVGFWSYGAGLLTGLLLAAPLAWIVSEVWRWYQMRGAY